MEEKIPSLSLSRSVEFPVSPCWSCVSPPSSSDYLDSANNLAAQFRVLSFARFPASLPKLQADREEILR